MNKLDELKSEKRILYLSFGGSFFFLLIEIFAVFFTSSQAVLIDCVYDMADLLMLLPFMILVPKLYKPVSEKWPYGLSQIEPLFVIIRCTVLLVLDAYFIFDSVQMILSGGNIVNATTVASFEFGMALSCIIIYLILKRLCRTFMSPTIESELYVWKVDAYSTAGVGVAFILQLILQNTPLNWITPYVDPGIAIILAVILLPEPLIMIRDSIRSLILVAPDTETLEQIRGIIEQELEEYDIHIDFLDIVQTGRKTWINVYIVQDSNMLDLSFLRKAQDEIISNLNENYDDIFVEFIPELEKIKPFDQC